MKKELIKQKVKSVIMVLLLLLTCCMIYFESQAQSNQKLTKEQYQVIEGAFKNSSLEYTKMFFQTIDYKSWVDSLYWIYDKQSVGVGLCSFEDLQLQKYLHQLTDHVSSIRIKNINPKRLGKRFVLIKDIKEKDYLSISEPIISENYALIFYQLKYKEGLILIKKNELGEWERVCGIPLYGTLID
jgi:hypothetical protein